MHLRSDLERKALAGVGEFERLPAAAYAPDARRRVYSVLEDKARRGDASDATPDIVRAQLQYEPGVFSPAWIVIDAGGGAEETFRLACAALGIERSPGP